MAAENGHVPQAIQSANAFEKLHGVGNYNTWKFQMKMSLVLEGLWKCVEGTDTDSTKDERALARICLGIKSCCIQHVRSANKSKQAWDALRSVFEDKGLYRRVLLLRQLHRANYTDYNSMNEYIEGVMTLVQQLADIGRVIEDKEVAEILLSGLPQEYDVLVSSLESLSSLEALTSEMVRARLLQEHFRRANNGNNNENKHDMVFMSTKRNIVCSYCKKTGHVKAKCFKFKREKAASKSPHKTETSTLFVSASAFATLHSSHIWIVDSGCTSHMCKDKEMFLNLDTNFKTFVTVANNDQLKCMGIGTVKLKFKNDSKTIKNVMYVPGLSANLLSVSCLTKNKRKVVFDNSKCHIYDVAGNLLTSATFINGIYRLECVPNVLCSQVSSNVLHLNKEQCSSVQSAQMELWHRRLGHLSLQGMCALRDGLAVGIDFQCDSGHLQDCIPCIEGKQTVKSFPKGQAKRAEQLLELIHSDVCGPMSQSSWGGARYLVTFTDDFSRKTFGYLMTQKNEVMECFINFKNLVEKQTGFVVKCLRSDNGTEYINKNFEKYLSQHGIIHQTTIPYSPQQNGVSERLNRTIIEKARCMLSEAGLEKRYWGEAVMTGIYLKNRSPTAALSGTIPEQVWTGSKVDLSHLRVFGCKVFSLIPDCHRQKLDSKSKQYIFVGYCQDSKGYRLVDPLFPKKIIKSRNVHFIEMNNNNIAKINDNNILNLNKDNISNMNNNGILNSNENNVSNMNNIILNYNNSNNISDTNNLELFDLETYNNNNMQNDNFTSVTDNLSVTAGDVATVEPSTGFEAPSQNVASSEKSASNNEQVASSEKSLRQGEQCFSPQSPDFKYQSCSDIDDDESPDELVAPQRSVRSTRGIPPKRFGDYEVDFSLLCQSYVLDEPQSYEDAINSPQKDEWLEAMKCEYNSLIENGVWMLVERPLNKNIIKTKWVFKVKQDTSGNFDKYKARLVARGFTQRPGVDYNQTFSPVVRHSTMRILFSIANDLDMDIDHIDVTTAFLNGKLNEEIYMEQPQGFKHNNKVCLLQKSIYGLKQASRVWNETVHNLLTKHGYRQTKCEPCVYIKRTNYKKLTILALYVDDFFIFSNCCKEKSYIINILSNNFNIKNLGPIKNCLGMSVHRDRTKGTILLRQSEYIKKLLSRFGMLDANGVSTPMQVNEKFENCDSNNSECDLKYRELVGSLMYLNVCTRPDISYCCSLLSQFNNSFNKSHWLAAKRVIRYLKGTIDHGLLFMKNNKNPDLEAFADADWANDPNDRKSFSGFVIKLGGNTISWESRKQRCVAMSSTEAEYLSMSNSCKDILFIRNLLFELTGKYFKCELRNDNQSAIKMLSTKDCHKRTKHIDVRYHFIKDLISKNYINVTYLPTSMMVADVLTKPLSGTKHKNFMSQLNVMM